MSSAANRTVKVRTENGTPKLIIDGHEMRPLIFFFNTEVPHGFKHWEPQVKMAAGADVHLYSFCLPWPWYEPGVEPDYSDGEAFMDRFIEMDPEALFIPRLRCEPPDEWLEAHPETRVTYADGSQAMMNSMASERWWEVFEKGMARTLQHYENSRFADRIVCYHPGGQNSNEWFHCDYWLKGPDYSEANQQGFRSFLSARYENDDALCRAWGREDIALETAVIPAMLPEVPSSTGSADAPFRVFLDPAFERDRLDFYDYTNDLMADRLVAIAELTKRETDWRKAVLIFYGYTFEMHAAESGHFAVRRLLDCDAIDMLSSPLSYIDRQPGGSCSFMTAIDSIPLNNKLWIAENDYRTHALDVSDLPDFITEEGLGKRAGNLEQSLYVVKREFGNMLTHRAGTWWMDLISGGAWEDPHIWQLIGDQLAPLYDEVLQKPSPCLPELAVIVDDMALRTLRYPPVGIQVTYNPAYDLLCRKSRDVFNRSGVHVGYYYLDDFLANRVPKTRLYWFIDPFRLSPAEVEVARGRLNQTRSMAVWQYAPCLDNPELAEKLTGLAVEHDAGAMGSRGEGKLDGLTWGEGFFLSPRVKVVSDDCDVLGRYEDGGGISAACTNAPGYPSCFVGDIQLTPEMVAAMAALAGVHSWGQPGSAVYTDGRVLFIHGGPDGTTELHAPDGIGVEALDGAPGTRCAPMQTRIFRLT